MINIQMLILGILVLVGGELHAQNLIRNASFEKCNHCPRRLGAFDKNVLGWKVPTLGSTDYFNGCSTNMGTPENFNGSQSAQSGSSYAGLYLYAPDDYREYIQANLVEPLVKGKEYRLEFFLSRAENSDFAIQDIGILISDREISADTKKALTKRHWYASGSTKLNYLELKGDSFWQDTDGWIELSTTFIADGSEKSIIVGNFNVNTRTKVKKTSRNARKGAYYYIDSFSLLPASDLATTAQTTPQFNLEGPVALNTTHRFENVLFEFDRSILLDTAKADIEKVYRYLINNGDLNIHIEGHTDNVGADSYNRSLSDNRCQAVVNYLMELGLDKNRISWRAHGGEQPVANNGTDAGRRLNRRVEFMFVQNEITQ